MLDETHSLDILKEITRIATSTPDLENILDKIITVIKNKMRIDACGIYLVDEEKGHLHLKASSGLPLGKTSNLTLEMGKGVTGWVAKNKVTLALSEALHDPRFVYFPEIEEEKYKSMLSAPRSPWRVAAGVTSSSSTPSASVRTSRTLEKTSSRLAAIPGETSSASTPPRFHAGIKYESAKAGLGVGNRAFVDLRARFGDELQECRAVLHGT